MGHGSHGCIERDNQNFRAMIAATKATRVQNAEKVDYEKFEALLEGIQISDYSDVADELFVVFECIDDNGDASFELENSIVYLVVRIPFQEMEEAIDPFKLQMKCFLSALKLLSEAVDFKSLAKECRKRLFVSV